MAAAEVMDAADALMHNDFNRSAVHLLETCFAGEVTIVQSITNGALTQGLEAAQSVPWQAFSGLTLAISMLLMFLGWYLVRAVNLFGGLYIGASVSVFLLTFSAGTPLMGDCLAMISVVTVSSLLCAIICLVYRKSMYLVLGMIAGEIVGKFVYHLCLETNGLGSNTLFVGPGAPWENAYAETFNGKLRDELLNGELFVGLDEARYLAERFRQEYNTHRPHSSLGYQTPSEFAASCAPSGSATLRLRDRSSQGATPLMTETPSS